MDKKLTLLLISGHLHEHLVTHVKRDLHNEVVAPMLSSHSSSMTTSDDVTMESEGDQATPIKKEPVDEVPEGFEGEHLCRFCPQVCISGFLMIKVRK